MVIIPNALLMWKDRHNKAKTQKKHKKMNLTLPFDEIKTIIDEKVKQPISFEFVNDHTLRINYEMNFLFAKKNFSADLEIKGISGSDLFLGYANSSDEMIVSSALKFAGDKIPEGLIEEKEGGNLILHLAQIEQAKPVFDKIDFKKITVLKEGINIEGKLKL